MRLRETVKSAITLVGRAIKWMDAISFPVIFHYMHSFFYLDGLKTSVQKTALTEMKRLYCTASPMEAEAEASVMLCHASLNIADYLVNQWYNEFKSTSYLEVAYDITSNAVFGSIEGAIKFMSHVPQVVSAFGWFYTPIKMHYTSAIDYFEVGTKNIVFGRNSTKASDAYMTNFAMLSTIELENFLVKTMDNDIFTSMSNLFMFKAMAGNIKYAFSECLVKNPSLDDVARCVLAHYPIQKAGTRTDVTLSCNETYKISMHEGHLESATREKHCNELEHVTYFPGAED